MKKQKIKSSIWRTVFDLEEKSQKLKELEKKSLDPHLWDNPENATEIKKEISSLESLISMMGDLKTEEKEIEEMLEFDRDEEFEKELLEKISEFERKVSQKEIFFYLSGKWDNKDAILEIHSGAGGRDSEDWATMLVRMYSKFFENNNLSFKILDTSYGEGGGPDGRVGIKHIIMKVSGNYAYGYLKNESGVHRLVRISPFSEKDLRHTSFAKVEVIPDFGSTNIEVELKDDDLEFSTFKSSGPGGQNVNKRETAVRIIHKPTQITVSCQGERNQARNRTEAINILKAKIYEKKEIKEKEKLENARNDSSASWGNQIRNYVLHPYKLVKDTRTKIETSDIESVLEGDLNKFIEAEIKLEIN